jgi:hypothetical protein
VRTQRTRPRYRAAALRVPRTETAWFLGEVTIAQPSGEPCGSRVSVLERKTDPKRRRIVERVISVEPDGPTREFVATLRVRGSRFIARCPGHFTGEGTLEGVRWRWTEWRGRYRLAKGRGIVSSWTGLSRNSLRGTKHIYDARHHLVVRLRERLYPVTRDTFELLRARLMHRRSVDLRRTEPRLSKRRRASSSK